MIKGIYSSEAAMRPKMARMEVIANNLANINTTGFKADRVFVRMLEQSAKGAVDERGDMTGVTTGKYIDTTSGSLQKTGNPFDLAIDGDGYFAVQTSRGIRLTRNGNFTLSKDGMLTTAEGHALLGTNGPIQVPQKERIDVRSLTVTQAGEVVIDKESVGQLRIVVPENPETLKKDHESLMFVDEDERILDIAPERINIQQGFVEESNVEGIQEMIAMIELSRGFETDQKMIQSQDATLDRSLEIGRM
jgi:flagellar basal-body rod protein FlgF